MKKIARVFTIFWTAFWFLVVLSPSAGAVYRVKKPEKPVFASKAEEKAYRLDRGEILTDGGYLKKGVWGVMEGVIDAPPSVVWKLFLATNDWKRYGLPTLKDSRAVTTDAALQSIAMKKVEEFYALIGETIVNPTQDRKTGAMWENYSFQYYDLPWPVSNKWMVLKNRNDETRAKEEVFRSEWSKVGGNVRTLSGRMVIESFLGDKNRTRMEYRIESDPGSAVPKFLLKWGIKRTMPAAIKVIRREASKIVGKPRGTLLKIHH